MASLAEHVPAAIVVLRDTWNRRRLRAARGLARASRGCSSASYILAVEGDGYRIYVKRADS